MLAAWTGLASSFGAHTGTPLVREGGALILFHPLASEFSPLHHPSYVDFFAEVLSVTTDPAQISAEFEKKFADRPLVRAPLPHQPRLPRAAPVAPLVRDRRAPRRAVGDVVWVGADRANASGSGFRAASTLADALEIVSSSVGRIAADQLPAHAAPGRGGRRVIAERAMSRELAPWAADGGKRRPPGRLADAVGDLRILATGWHWDLAVDVVTAGREHRGRHRQGGPGRAADPHRLGADTVPGGGARLAQTGVLRPVLKAEVNLESHGTERLARRSGPSLLVANHASHLDIGAVLATLPPSWRDRTASR